MNLTKYNLIKIIFSVVLSVAIISCSVKEKKVNNLTKPNIIVILSDDMGYSDLGCYGGEINTPVLDNLAANGIRFTQFYNTGRCCPTRASLLTGLYPHQASIGHMMGDDNLPGYRGDLGNDCVTIAEALKLAGYKNYMAGKWHVTPVPDGDNMVNASKHNWPLQRGFDRFYGTIHGATSFYDPFSLARGNEFISPDADDEYKPKEYYYTDAIADNASRFIREHKENSPFFMYVAFTAAHWPMHAPEDEIAKYKGHYDAGYGAIREARHKKMLELGVINENTIMSEQVGNWDKVEHLEWEKRCMETYAAMITRMDAGIEKIVKTLEENGQLENTLIMFMQDNGGCQETYGRPEPEEGNRWHAVGGERAEVSELPPMEPGELQTHMVPHQTRDGQRIRMGPRAMPGPEDTYIAYGINWANVSNTPFRMYKHFVHEGGISTPLIAYWPKGIEAKNELRHTPTHLIDIMATCVDLAGAEYPEFYAGNKIQPMEGKSLKSVFDSDELQDRHILFEHEGNAAIRKGKWKLVGKKVIHDETTERENWELYDIEADRSELNDLSKVFPGKVEELKTLFEEEAWRVRFFPSKYTKN